MKRCYIAGKITGLPESEWKQNFEQAKKEVSELGFIPVSPIDLPHNHAKTWRDYMKEDLTALLTCDCIYLLENWESSRGAIIEFHLAVQLEIETMYQPKVANLS